MIDKMIALFIIVASLIVGVSTSVDEFTGSGIVLFGCVACFIGGCFVLVELSIKGGK